MPEALLSIKLFLTNAPSHTPIGWGATIAFGLVIGSFLNVVIYRLGMQMKGTPSKKLGLCNPKRSFCPSCKTELTWMENIPIISYILQNGACKTCKIPIPIRYPAVELAGLAAVAAPWAWAPSGSAAIGGAVFLVAMLTITAIDLETKKIPDKVSLTCLAFALGLAFLPGGSGQAAVLGAGGVFLLMLGLVELGKRLFGKKTITMKEPPEILWADGALTIQEPGKTLEESEAMRGNDLPFLRKTDRIVLEGTFQVGQEEIQKTTVSLSPDSSDRVTGRLKTITFPREAMGMGDVKLMALCGAVVGFEGAVQGLTAGAIIALIFIFFLRMTTKLTKNNPPEMIAFGPWIAAGSSAVLIASWISR